MDYTFWIIGAGLFMCILGYDYSTKKVLWNVMSLGLGMIVCSPIINRLATGLDSNGEMSNVGMGILIFTAGALVVFIMTEAFKHSSPFSTSPDQFWMFGFFKWDEFAQIWLVGAVVLLGAGLFLGFELINAWNRGEADAVYKTSPPVVSKPAPIHVKELKAVRHSPSAAVSAAAGSTSHSKHHSSRKAESAEKAKAHPHK